MATEADPAAPADSTAWTKPCPHCQAKVQPVARRCWHCGEELAEPGADIDYRPSNAEEVNAVSVTIIAALAVAVPVMFFAWLWSLLR
jgi:hypothetical protein